MRLEGRRSSRPGSCGRAGLLLNQLWLNAELRRLANNGWLGRSGLRSSRARSLGSRCSLARYNRSNGKGILVEWCLEWLRGWHRAGGRSTLLIEGVKDKEGVGRGSSGWAGSLGTSDNRSSRGWRG